MSMRGIDVSNWQSNIDLSKVDADFIIIKATEGVSYISPSCDKQYQQAKKAGRCLGVYHYANGGNATAEADHFLKNVKNYIGEAILVLDWESGNNSLFGKSDLAWCKKWCDYVYAKTGVKPLVYIQASALSRLSGIGDYGFWVAQYANSKSTGYQDTPWNEGKYTCVIRQYSSTGKLAGYSGNLDLNKAYINKSEWANYAGVTATNTTATAVEEKTFKFVEANVLGRDCKFTGFIEKNENWVKVTTALDVIGYTAKWNSTKKRAIAVKNGKETLLDIRTYISADNVSFCPIRDLYKYLGYAVNWDSEKKIISVM